MPAPEQEIPLRVGVKYCGGCKPGYDRVALVENIKARLRDRVRMIPPDGDGVALILAVQGCPTACADLSPYEGLFVRPITSPASAEAFITAVESGIVFENTKTGTSNY
jgi:hypothetical protein